MTNRPIGNWSGRAENAACRDQSWLAGAESGLNQLSGWIRRYEHEHVGGEPGSASAVPAISAPAFVPVQMGSSARSESQNDHAAIESTHASEGRPAVEPRDVFWRGGQRASPFRIVAAGS